MAVKQYKKGVKVILSEHFSSLELDCKCSYPECQNTLISDELVQLLEKIRNEIGKPLIINDSFRCFRHNQEVGGVPGSQHPQGLAADLKLPDGFSPLAFGALIDHLLDGTGGRGMYDSFCHSDVRSNGPARWDNRTKK